MPVIRKMVHVIIHQSVNLDGSMDIPNVIKYVNQRHLELTVLRNVTVSTNHVIKALVHVLLVDVNVDIKRMPVVQNAVLVTMASIVINHVMGAYPIIVIGNLVFAQIHLDANLEGCLVGCMDVWSVIQIATMALLVMVVYSNVIVKVDFATKYQEYVRTNYVSLDG